MSRRPPDTAPDLHGRSPSPQPPFQDDQQQHPPSGRRRPSVPVHPPLVSSSAHASSAAALGVAGGRGPRGSSARRSSRRASVDPYPAASSRQTSPEAALRPPARETALRRASRSRTPSKESVQEAEMGGRGAAEEPEEAAALQNGQSDMNFRLVMLQQPEIGAAAGRGTNTFGRLPVIPAPVVELIAEDQSGARLEPDFPFLFTSCTLLEGDGSTAVEVAAPPSSDDGVNEEFSALLGGLVRQAQRVEDVDGTPRDVFVFEDVSVRTKGSYRLEFTLGQAVRPKSPKLAAVRSEPFDVVDWQDYPGRPVAETVPELSLHLHNQGVPMYIPPLLLSQPGDNPPPAGFNPFPPGALDDLVPAAPPDADQQPLPPRQ